MSEVKVPMFAGKYMVGYATETRSGWVEVRLDSGRANDPWGAAVEVGVGYVAWVYDYATQVMHFAGEG